MHKYLFCFWLVFLTTTVKCLAGDPPVSQAGVSCCKASGVLSGVCQGSKEQISDLNSISYCTGFAPVTYLPAITICSSNGTVEIPVKVNSFSDIGAISLTIQYDSNILVYQSFINSSGYPGLDVDCSVPGTLVAGGFASEGISLDDSTVLLTLSFMYLGGSTTLSFVDNGTSCEFAGPPPTWQPLPDSPQQDFYVDGEITGLTIPANAGLISGPPGDYVCAGQMNVPFSVQPIINAQNYIWTVPDGATIVSGNNTNSITVDFSTTSIAGNVAVYGDNICGTGSASSVFINILFAPASPGLISGSDSVCTGENEVMYTVEPVSNATSYNWVLPEGAVITSGQYTNTIFLSFDESAESGFLSLTGINACFNGPSSLPFQITIGSGPFIIEQPLSPLPVMAGAGLAHIQVVASGLGLSYQWQVYNSEWENILTDEFYSGVNTDELVITNPLPAMDGLTFRCHLQGECEPEQFTDGNAVLTVIDPMGIDSPWFDQTKQNTIGIGQLRAILYPNPSKYKSMLSMFIPEKGDIRCLLVNSLGQSYLIKDKESVEPGNFQFEINSKLFSPGQYILMLQFTTRNFSISNPLRWIIE